MEDIREIFRFNRKKIKMADFANLDRILDEFCTELELKLDEYEKKIDEIMKKNKITHRKAIAELVSAGSLSIASALFPPLTIPAILLSLELGGKSMRDLHHLSKLGRQDVEELQSRHLGILLEVRARSDRQSK